MHLLTGGQPTQRHCQAFGCHPDQTTATWPKRSNYYRNVEITQQEQEKRGSTSWWQPQCRLPRLTDLPRLSSFIIHCYLICINSGYFRTGWGALTPLNPTLRPSRVPSSGNARVCGLSRSQRVRRHAQRRASPPVSSAVLLQHHA